MKKIIFILASTFLLVGCLTDTGAYNPGLKDEETFVHVGSKKLKLYYVTFNNGRSHIYMLAPVDSTVKVTVENIGFTSGKVQTSVIKVE